MFKYNHFEMMEIIDSPVDGSKSDSNKRLNSKIERRDLYADGFHWLLEEGKDETFLAWIYGLKKNGDDCVNVTIKKNYCKSLEKNRKATILCKSSVATFD